MPGRGVPVGTLDWEKVEEADADADADPEDVVAVAAEDTTLEVGAARLEAS